MNPEEALVALRKLMGRRGPGWSQERPAAALASSTAVVDPRDQEQARWMQNELGAEQRAEMEAAFALARELDAPPIRYHEGRAHYNPWGIGASDAFGIMAELPHHVQYKQEGNLRMFGRLLEGLSLYRDDWDSGLYGAFNRNVDPRPSRYYTPGTLEYEAHAEIQPELYDRYAERLHAAGRPGGELIYDPMSPERMALNRHLERGIGRQEAADLAEGLIEKQAGRATRHLDRVADAEAERLWAMRPEDQSGFDFTRMYEAQDARIEIRREIHDAIADAWPGQDLFEDDGYLLRGEERAFGGYEGDVRDIVAARARQAQEAAESVLARRGIIGSKNRR